MKINIWVIIKIFVFLYATYSFYLQATTYLQRVSERKYEVILKGRQYKNERFGDFKDIRTIKTLKSYDEPYRMFEEATINFVGCCLERQTLVFQLFEQKEIDNHFQIAEINNVFLTGECDFFYNDTLYQFCRLFDNALNVINFPTGEIIYFDSVLHIFMSSPFQIGTFLFETLSSVSMFPQKILQKSMLILCETNKFVLDSLATFGITEEHIHVKTHPEEIYHVRHLYTIYPHPCNLLNPASFAKMRSYFVEYYNLDKEPPKKYVMITLKDKPNELTNYQEVLDEFNLLYPDIQWELDNEPTLFSSLLPFYNDIKLFFSCTSKNSVLTFIMQKGSVVVEIQGNFFEPLALHVSAYLGHHHIIARIPDMKIPKSPEPYKLPINTAKEMLKLALKYLNYSESS